MLRRGDFFKLGVLAIAAALAGCTPRISATYRVALHSSASSEVLVDLELHHAPRQGLSLQAYADQQAMRLADVRATDGRGVPVRSEVRHRTITTKGRQVEIPYVSIPGPLPRVVRIRYRVAPTRREGDDHLGFTGTCFGEINGRFALLTGRNVFLVPQEVPGLRAQVEFDLPAGWNAVTTWRDPRPASWRKTSSHVAAEDLVSGTIGLGRFRERSFRHGTTEYRFAVESGISPTEESRLLAGLERATRFVHRVFRRGPGPSYRTIVTPSAMCGDEIAGEGSSSGQGGTMAPITAGRLRLYADRLISAYLLYPPTRTQIRDPREYWLVDAVRSWYAWRAVEDAGLVRDDEVTRETALAYLAAYQATNIDRNLERMYAQGEPNPFVRNVLAPASLVYLDRVLSGGTNTAHPIDQVLPKVFRGRFAPSFWTSLPRSARDGWADFRARYAQGNRLVPVERLLPLEPTRPNPPRSGPGGRRLTLVVTGDTHGFLENCGCKVNQSGGVARRAKKIAEIRRNDGPVLLLDAGSAFARPKRSGDVDALSRLEQGLYLRTMESMGYAAVSIGTSELALGPDYFKKMTRDVSIPFLSANVRVGGHPVAPPSIVVDRAGLRIGIIGVFDPPRGGLGERVFEARTTEVTFEDPATALRRQVRALRSRADLIVALGRLDPYAIRRVIAGCPGIDVLVSTQSEAPNLRVVDGDTLVARSDAPGFVRGTLVVYTSARQYGLDAARLVVDGTGRVTGAEVEEYRLGEESGEDPRTRRMLDRFYGEVGKTEAAQASVGPLFSWDPDRAAGRYTGAKRCAACHEDEFIQWSSTKHAGAFKTLLEVHRHFQPKCVSCHVVGFGTPHGYKLGTPRETLANVQCEVCHGPGQSHADEPTAANIRKEVPERVCVECHNPEHSDHFVYAEKLPRVKHDFDAGLASSEVRSTAR